MSLLKKVWIGLCVVVSSAEASITDEERRGGGYFSPSITAEKCNNAAVLLKERNEPIIKEFKQDILPYLNLTELNDHPQFDVFQKFINHKAFLRTKEKFARGASTTLTHYWKDPQTRDERDNTVEAHLEGLRNALHNAYTINGQTAFFPEAAKQFFETDRKQALVACEERYNHTVRKIRTNDALLRYWVAENILFGPERSAEALIVWQALKSSGLIQTMIPDNLKGWSYNLSTAVKEFFIDHPQTTVLTLGCGTSVFMQEANDDLTEYGTELAGSIFSCVSCSDTHGGELSVALPEAWKESRSYAPSSHATLRGDMFDEALWGALGARRFSTIKDHSCYHQSSSIELQLELVIKGDASTEESIKNAMREKENYSRYAKNIATFLEKGGMFELLGSGRLDKESYIVRLFSEAGLSLNKIEHDNNRLIFYKL